MNEGSRKSGWELKKDKGFDAGAYTKGLSNDAAPHAPSGPRRATVVSEDLVVFFLLASPNRFVYNVTKWRLKQLALEEWAFKGFYLI